MQFHMRLDRLMWNRWMVIRKSLEDIRNPPWGATLQIQFVNKSAAARWIGKYCKNAVRLLSAREQ